MVSIEKTEEKPDWIDRAATKTFDEQKILAGKERGSEFFFNITYASMCDHYVMDNHKCVSHFVI